MHSIIGIIAKYYAFLSAWAIFGVTSLYFYFFGKERAAEKKSILGLISFAFPWKEWKSGSSRIDIFVFVAEKFFGAFHLAVSVALPTFIAVWLSSQVDFSWVPHLQSSIWAMAVVGVVLLILMDFADYVSHFLQHFVPFLWEIHKMHHAATYLTPITARRVHLAGEMFEELLVTLLIVVPLAIFRVMFHLSIPDMLALMGLANGLSAILVLDSLRHSHLPVSFGRFDAVLMSPHMHQLHHSSKIAHWDKNFGHRFSVWDWWFGTMLVPIKGESFPWGLGKSEQEEYNTMFGAYILPFVKMAKLVGGKPLPDYKGGLVAQDPSFFRRVLWRSPSDIYAKQRMLNLLPNGAEYGAAE